MDGLRRHHLRTAAIGIGALVVVIASAPGASAGLPGCGPAALVRAAPTPASDRAVLCLVNQQRAVHHLAPLALNARLTWGAKRHSRQMVSDRYFSHGGPGNSNVVTRVRHTGYLVGARGWAVGETLAFADGPGATPAGLVAMLLASPPHRAILLDRGYRDIGIGIGAGAPTPSSATLPGATLTLDLAARSSL